MPLQNALGALALDASVQQIVSELAAGITVTDATAEARLQTLVTLLQGALTTRLYDPNTSRYARVNTFAAAIANPMMGEVNTGFYTATAVTDQYTVTSAGGGAGCTSTTTDGFFTMTTGNSANGQCQITSKDTASYNGIAPLDFLNGLRLGQAGVATVTRRWGMYDDNNGYYFEDFGGTLRVVSRKAGANNPVAAGSFNGAYGAAYSPGTNAHFYEIEVTGGRAVFMVDSQVLHTMAPNPGQTTLTANLATLPIRVEAFKIGGDGNAYTIEGRGHNIVRLGGTDSKRMTESILDVDVSALTRAVATLRLGVNSYIDMLGMDTGALVADKPKIQLGGPASVSTGGNSTVYTPSSGKTPRLKWIHLAVQDDGGSTTVATVRWKATGGGTSDIYTTPLSVPGVFAKTTNRDGPGPDAQLVVNLTTPRLVYVNMDMEEH